MRSYDLFFKRLALPASIWAWDSPPYAFSISESIFTPLPIAVRIAVQWMSWMLYLRLSIFTATYRWLFLLLRNNENLQQKIGSMMVTTATLNSPSTRDSLYVRPSSYLLYRRSSKRSVGQQLPSQQIRRVLYQKRIAMLMVMTMPASDRCSRARSSHRQIT